MVDYKQILRLRAEGVSQRGIAEVLGCSRNTVAAVFAAGHRRRRLVRALAPDQEPGKQHPRLVRGAAGRGVADGVERRGERVQTVEVLRQHPRRDGGRQLNPRVPEHRSLYARRESLYGAATAYAEIRARRRPRPADGQREVALRCLAHGARPRAPPAV